MIVIEVRCDKCGIVGASRASTFAHLLREELKAQRWKVAMVGGKDFCPKCKPRRKPRRRSRTTIKLVNSERKTGAVNKPQDVLDYGWDPSGVADNTAEMVRAINRGEW